MSRERRNIRGVRTPRRTGSQRAGSSACLHSVVTATSATSETRSNKKQPNLDSPHDNARRVDELLNCVDSGSATPSSTSSTFSPPTTMSRSGQSISLHALTPLTSSDSSPPGKLLSPRSAKPSYETMSATASSLPAPSSAPNNDTNTITPINTPPETRRSVWPADGVVAKRLYYDPSTDTKLDKKARQNRPPQYKSIVDKVCEGYI
jgi:histone-lysine N-methyltransferase SETD1